jgi:hypothetical protein
MSIVFEMETFEVSFSNETEKSISYSFTKVPKLTATTDDNINIYLSNITDSSCTINASTKFTGTVYVHAIGVVY